MSEWRDDMENAPRDKLLWLWDGKTVWLGSREGSDGWGSYGCITDTLWEDVEQWIAPTHWMLAPEAPH